VKFSLPPDSVNLLLHLFLTLKMEAIGSSETPESLQTTRRHNPAGPAVIGKFELAQCKSDDGDESLYYFFLSVCLTRAYYVTGLWAVKSGRK
jgi:hypothetical protein